MKVKTLLWILVKAVETWNDFRRRFKAVADAGFGGSGAPPTDQTFGLVVATL